MSTFLVPPGGFAGFSQMTPASKAALGGTRSRGPARRKRRKSAKKAKGQRRARKSGGRKLKFGSPAWRKKYMKKGRK